MTDVPDVCACEEGTECWYFPGYPYCRTCADHHRTPECPVDVEGFGVAQCGCRWVDVDQNIHTDSCAWSDL